MRRLSIYIIASAIVLLASCHKDSTPAGTASIRFQPKWGTTDLKLNTTYSTPDGKYLNFSSVGLYMSHIKFVRTDNTEVEVSPKVLLNYTDNAIIFTVSPTSGTYKAVKFNIGLDSTQNKVAPDPNVIADAALYWDDTRLHLFIQLLGYSGTSSALGGTFFYHEGNDSINTIRTATVSKSFTVADGQATTLALDANLEQVFYGTGAVDVLTRPGTHTRDFPQTATIVADAFSQIFSIQ